MAQENPISAAEVEKYIGGIDFPVDKSQLLSHAENNGAPKDVLEFMNNFPEQEYANVTDVSQTISEVKH